MLFKQILKDWGLEALILFLFVYFILPFGPAITFDSVSFFQAGDNFWSSGHYVHYSANGELEFAAHRFPIYPLILGLFRSLGVPLVLLQIVLFTGFLIVTHYLLKLLNVPKYALLLLCTFPIFLSFYALWTEGLYALLFVGMCYLIKKDEAFISKWWMVIILTLLCLTRMVGLVVCLALFLTYLIENRKWRATLFLAVGLLVVGSWTFLGAFYLGDTARSIDWHPVNYLDLQFIVIEMGYWISAVDQQIILITIGLCLIVVPLLILKIGWKSRLENGLLFWFLNLHFVGYLLFIILSKSLIDASIAFDERTLFPLMLNFILILAELQSGNILSDKQKGKMKFMLPKLFLLIVLLNFPLIWLVRSSGIGYNSTDWQAFEFTDKIEELKTDICFTNDQAAIYLFGSDIHHPHLLPQKKDLYSQQVHTTYDAEMDVMIHQLKESENGKIIWIRNGITAEVFPSYEELQNHPDLSIIYDDWLCLIIEYKRTSSE